MSLTDAVQALRAAGLSGNDFDRAYSHTHETWLVGPYVIRLAGPGGSERLTREAMLLGTLPKAVRAAEVVDHGWRAGRAWMVLHRRPGELLSEAWPQMGRHERRGAMSQLAEAIRALHGARMPVPTVGAGADGQPDDLHGLPIDRMLLRLDQAARLRGADPQMIDRARGLVARLPSEVCREVPVHADLHFDNILWHEGELSAILDFEWCTSAPADVELDGLLQFFAKPWLIVAASREADQRAELYREAPGWLAEDYPDLFAAADLRDRLTLYGVGRLLRGVLSQGEWTFGPRSWGGRIDALLRGDDPVLHLAW